MLTVLDNLTHLFGYGLCHQLPERSFDYGGVMWPVCARCAGIYLGIIFGLVALFLAYRGRQRSGGMSLSYWAVLGLALAAMALDGFSSYLGWRDTNNLLRLATGAAVGVMIAPLMYTLLVGTLARESVNKVILKGGVRPALYLALAVLAAGVLTYVIGPVAGPVSALLVALCIWLTFSLLALMLVGLARIFERTVVSWRDLLLPGAISAIIGLLLIIGLALLKVWLIG